MVGDMAGVIIDRRWATQSGGMLVNRARSALLVLMTVVCATSAAALDSAQVRVRFPEGVTRGFLVIRTPQGERIGHGELIQKPRGDEVDSRLLLQFKDGSVHDERTTYSQRGVFRLEAYHLTQRGPSFPGADVAFDRKSGRYQAKTHEKAGAPEETASGEFEIRSPDLANGLTLLLLKNMPRGERVTAQLAAFTPKPRLLRMELHQEGEDRVVFAGDGKQAARHLVDLEIGGVTRRGGLRHRQEPARPPLLAGPRRHPRIRPLPGRDVPERPGVARGDGRGRLGSRHSCRESQKSRGQAWTLVFGIGSP